MVVWEMLNGGRVPYDNMSTNQEVIEFTLSGGRLKVEPLPGSVLGEGLREVIYECWDEKPDGRPTFAQLARKMRKLIERLDGRGVKMPDQSLVTNSSQTLEQTYAPVAASSEYYSAITPAHLSGVASPARFDE
jgi:Protein tyrosine and serine/threonine kinase